MNIERDIVGELEIESKELSDKIDKLGRFIFSDKFCGISRKGRKLLVKQHNIMVDYNRVLGMRAEQFKKDNG